MSGFHVVILSANPANVIACVRAILRHEPSLAPERIIVVDDGAREGAERELPGIRWVEGIRPFVFARNANLGIAAAGGDVVLMNDDALLVTAGGLTALASHACSGAGPRLVSAAIRGAVGNANQRPRAGSALRTERGKLCFVCVYIVRALFDEVGALDERFVGYGYEDDDYSRRAGEAGFQIAVSDACVVDHTLSPTYRSRPDFAALERLNHALYVEKRGHRQYLLVIRVRNGAAFVGEAVEGGLSLCQRAFIFDDHSDDDTPRICRSFGPRVTIIDSPFEGFDEARDKNFILRAISANLPDWVLWIDADEVLERGGAERIRRGVARGGNVAAYSLRIAYLWDAPHQVRVDGIFGRFHRESLFRAAGQPFDRLHFPSRGVAGPNLHCGNVPRGLSGTHQRIDVRLKHYGYLTEEQRRAKYAWYTRMDPGNTAEDHYRHIGGVAGARHAPGPMRLVPWTE